MNPNSGALVTELGKALRTVVLTHALTGLCWVRQVGIFSYGVLDTKKNRQTSNKNINQIDNTRDLGKKGTYR